jgi:hypothetical protein
MIEIIKTGTVGFICYKALVCFGKKDIAEVIAFVAVLSIGCMICLKISGWYDSLMNSRIVELLEKIF